MNEIQTSQPFWGKYMMVNDIVILLGNRTIFTRENPGMSVYKKAKLVQKIFYTTSELIYCIDWRELF